MSEHADFSRTCEGCEYIRTELWPVKGSYSNTAVAYRCFAPGPHKGYHMGTARLLPYVPAWCPRMKEKGDGNGSERKGGERYG